MSDAGLTNGALYTHFASKDDLVATTITDQLRTQRDALHAMADDPDAIPAFLGMYLSKTHRDTPADGCPSGAMLANIARSSAVVKDAYTAGVIEVGDALAAHLDLTDDPEAGGRLAAIALLSCLIGTVQMARSINDPDLSQAVLDLAGLRPARRRMSRKLCLASSRCRRPAGRR
jgi:TetR/AcrR family transcriptional repressor of nem operon